MFDKNDPIDIVRHFSTLIDNGRTLRDISNHANKEFIELKEELDKIDTGEPEGVDGVIGEAVDIMACVLDIIFVHRPATTTEEIATIMLAKCEKWSRRYKDDIHGDRSID